MMASPTPSIDSLSGALGGVAPGGMVPTMGSLVGHSHHQSHSSASSSSSTTSNDHSSESGFAVSNHAHTAASSMAEPLGSVSSASPASSGLGSSPLGQSSLFPQVSGIGPIGLPTSSAASAAPGKCGGVSGLMSDYSTPSAGLLKNTHLNGDSSSSANGAMGTNNVSSQMLPSSLMLLGI